MKIMNIEVTELEVKLLQVMNDQSSGDCNRTMTGVEDGHAWFGFFDKDFTASAEAAGLVGREISGIASSLKKKGLIEVYVEENYFTGRYDRIGMEVFKKCKAFEVLDQTLKEATTADKSNKTVTVAQVIAAMKAENLGDSSIRYVSDRLNKV